VQIINIEAFYVDENFMQVFDNDGIDDMVIGLVEVSRLLVVASISMANTPTLSKKHNTFQHHIKPPKVNIGWELFN
jgi:hypothetical protein